MRYFLGGGSKSGKSMLGQRLARDMADGAPLYYIATMIPCDAEDHARIRRHLQEREGWGFTTVECGASLLTGLQGCDWNGSFLLDSVTALLSNAMFSRDGTMHADAPEQVAQEVEALCQRCRKLVIVSDDLYTDARRFDRWTQRYCAGLAMICCRAAALCDVAVEVSAGVPICWKGALD